MSRVYKGIKGVDYLIRDIIDKGIEVENSRTGTTTKALFDAKIVIPEGEFPFTTNLMASPRLAFEELWLFLRGQTDTKILEEKGVFFWKGNTSREFLNKRGLPYLKEGDLGTAYSRQWRDFGGVVTTQEYKGEYVSEGVDQLEQLIEGLSNDKCGRRHLVTLWNPNENDLGVLTPCWHTSQYVVLPNDKGKDVLHVKLINRSLDVVFGTRFAIQQYRMFQMALCKMFGFKLGRLSCDLSHVHIYENQYEYAKELIERDYVDPALSTIKLNKDIHSLEELLALEWGDWDMVYKTNTTPFRTPRPEMIA